MRCLLASALVLLLAVNLGAEQRTELLAGTGTAGFGPADLNLPYGVVMGPDGALYICEAGNHVVRRLDLKTSKLTVVAGTGVKGYAGDGGPATEALLSSPHEIRFGPDGSYYLTERDSHVVRKIDGKTGIVSTLAGTGEPGFSGDGGPAAQARLRQPHSIVLDGKGGLLICDIGNHRVRRVHLASGMIETVGGTGERAKIAEGTLLRDAPLNGPRTMAMDSNGDLYLALREGNAIYRVDGRSHTLHHVAGTGGKGYSGDGGPAQLAALAGPKGIALSPGRELYIADQTHTVRAIHLRTGIIRTVLGTGVPGDGPDGDPSRCLLHHPHGVFVHKDGAVFVTNSDAHTVRVIRGTPER